MARIVGIDYGKKRVGIAVTDPMQLIASPLKTIPTHTTIEFLQTYMQKETVASIVVGWPIQLNGLPGTTARLVKQFIRLLEKYFPKIPIVAYDERFTSVMAQKSLLQMGLKKKERQKKERLDAMSATFILRSFMEHDTWKKSQLIEQDT